MLKTDMWRERRQREVERGREVDIGREVDRDNVVICCILRHISLELYMFCFSNNICLSRNCSRDQVNYLPVIVLLYSKQL